MDSFLLFLKTMLFSGAYISRTVTVFFFEHEYTWGLVGRILLVNTNEKNTWIVSSVVCLTSLLGTIYGGDGRTTFALPDLRGRAPIHMGQGLGLTARSIGSKGGSETVTVGEAHYAPHHHTGAVTGKHHHLTANLSQAVRSNAILDASCVGDTNVQHDHVVVGHEHQYTYALIQEGDFWDVVALSPLSDDDICLADPSIRRDLDCSADRCFFDESSIPKGYNVTADVEGSTDEGTTAGGQTTSTDQSGQCKMTLEADFTDVNTSTSELPDAFSKAANGGGQPHSNQSPYLAVNYIIAVRYHYPGALRLLEDRALRLLDAQQMEILCLSAAYSPLSLSLSLSLSFSASTHLEIDWMNWFIRPDD